MFQKMVIVLSLLLFGAAGCASGPGKVSENWSKQPKAIFFSANNDVMKSIIVVGIKDVGVSWGAGMQNPPSKADAVATLLYNLWNSQPPDKALYVEQVSSKVIVGEDKKEKTIQMITILVFSSTAKNWQQGWYITGELLSTGAVKDVSLRKITPENFSKDMFSPISDVYVYAWIEREVIDPAITSTELVKKILPYRAFTFSVLQQIQKKSNEQKPVEQIKKQPEEPKQST